MFFISQVSGIVDELWKSSFDDDGVHLFDKIKVICCWHFLIVQNLVVRLCKRHTPLRDLVVLELGCNAAYRLDSACEFTPRMFNRKKTILEMVAGAKLAVAEFGRFVFQAVDKNEAL